jgi:hypothetical protein
MPGRHPVLHGVNDGMGEGGGWGKHLHFFTIFLPFFTPFCFTQNGENSPLKTTTIEFTRCFDFPLFFFPMASLD